MPNEYHSAKIKLEDIKPVSNPPDNTKDFFTEEEQENIAGLIVAKSPDSYTEEEQAEEQELEKEAKRLKNQSDRQNIEERKNYAGKIYWLIVFWLLGIGEIMFLQGFLSPLGLFQLSDKVLIALIGGTTINVVGLFVIVARYLFQSKEPPKA